MSILKIIGSCILMLLILGSAFFYVGRKIYLFLKEVLKNLNSKVYISVYVTIVILMFGGVTCSVINMPTVVKVILKVISSFVMGIFVYTFIFFLFVDSILIIGILFKIVNKRITKKIRVISGLIVLCLTLIIDVYGLINGSIVRSKFYSINLLKEKDSKGDEDNKDYKYDIMNIVLISDVHLGAINSENRISSIVHNINALKPDVVCITGDIFDNDYNTIYNPQKVISNLKNIKSTYGVYACLGNHDTGNTVGNMVQLLEKSGIKLLNEEYEVIDNRMILVGRLDSSLIYDKVNIYRENTQEMIKKVKNKNEKLPIVVMDHNPIHISEYGKEVNLILSGHTHRGQIFPGSLFTKNIYDVDYGYYQKNMNYPHVIVTSGVGTWGIPMRIGTDSEVVQVKINL